MLSMQCSQDLVMTFTPFVVVHFSSSFSVIEREMKYISFDEERRNRPHEVGYKDFYQYLTPTVTPVRKNREITSS